MFFGRDNKYKDEAFVTPEPASNIVDTFRQNLERTQLNNDNEILELEATIADASERLAHRKNVKNALNIALIELDMHSELRTVAEAIGRDIATIPLTVKHHAV